MQDELRKHLHGVSNGLQASFDALENIEVSLFNDVEYCKEVIKLSKSEKLKAFEHMEKLRILIRSLKNNE